MEKVFFKGLALMEAMVAREEPSGITELATELGMTKSNVHRLLQTMVECGYATKDPLTNRYECTLKLWQLGSVLGNRLDLRTIARPYLQELSRATRESVHLSIRHGRDAVYIDKINCAHPIGTFAQVGGRAPAYAVSTGKALLSALSDEELGRLYSDFERFTDKTIVTLDRLKAEMAAVRRRGYATNRGEWHESVGGIAAPIYDASQSVRGAIGVSGPLERLTPKTMQTFATLATRAAEDISRAMGYCGDDILWPQISNPVSLAESVNEPV
jgi:IclR family KDG regulon transcriptional repressor